MLQTETFRTFLLRIILANCLPAPRWSIEVTPSFRLKDGQLLGHCLWTLLSVGPLWGLDSWDFPGESCRNHHVGDQDVVRPHRTQFADRFLEGTGREKNVV